MPIAPYVMYDSYLRSCWSKQGKQQQLGQNDQADDEYFYVLVHMSSLRICIISHVYVLSGCSFGQLSGHQFSWLAGWADISSSVLHGWNINIWHQVQTFQPISFIPTIFMSTIDLYHLSSVWMTLMFAGGCKVNGKLNLLGSFSSTFLS